MEVNKAMEQIDQIYGHLAKSEIYRGYRPIPVAFTGVLALAAGFFQSWVLADSSPVHFVIFWVTISIISVALISVEIVYEYFVSRSVVFRRSTHRVICQFLPCMVTGAVLTLIVTLVPSNMNMNLIYWLPGLWGILFSLGIFASRPYLPRASGWVGLFYFLSGCILFWLAGSGHSLSPWGMSSVFGPGQLLSALVLYKNLERKEDA